MVRQAISDNPYFNSRYTTSFGQYAHTHRSNNSSKTPITMNHFTTVRCQRSQSSLHWNQSAGACKPRYRELTSLFGFRAFATPKTRNSTRLWTVARTPCWRMLQLCQESLWGRHCFRNTAISAYKAHSLNLFFNYYLLKFCFNLEDIFYTRKISEHNWRWKTTKSLMARTKVAKCQNGYACSEIESGWTSAKRGVHVG